MKKLLDKIVIKAIPCARQETWTRIIDKVYLTLRLLLPGFLNYPLAAHPVNIDAINAVNVSHLSGICFHVNNQINMSFHTKDESIIVSRIVNNITFTGSDEIHVNDTNNIHSTLINLNMINYSGTDVTSTTFPPANYIKHAEHNPKNQTLFLLNITIY